MKHKEIDIALIGVGYWGSKLKKYIKANKNFNLKYICDTNSNLNEVWNDRSVIAVVIAVPNEAHYSIAKQALFHGKNVLCEKPLTLKTEECEKLRQIAGDKLLLTDFTHTFSKGLIKIKERVDNGEVGKILVIEMARKQMKRYVGGNVYWLLGSHLLAVLDMFIPLERISFDKVDLVVKDGEVETGIIVFGNEICGQIFVSLGYPEKESRITIYGDKGTITYNLAESKNDLENVISYFYKALKGQAEGNIDRAISVTKTLENLI